MFCCLTFLTPLLIVFFAVLPCVFSSICSNVAQGQFLFTSNHSFYHIFGLLSRTNFLYDDCFCFHPSVSHVLALLILRHDTCHV